MIITYYSLKIIFLTLVSLSNDDEYTRYTSVEVVVIMLYGERVYLFPIVRITTHMPNTENEYTCKHY